MAPGRNKYHNECRSLEPNLADGMRSGNPRDYCYLLSSLKSFTSGVCFLLYSSLNFIFNKSDVAGEILSYLKLLFNFYLDVGLCIHTVLKNWEVSSHGNPHCGTVKRNKQFKRKLD